MGTPAILPANFSGFDEDKTPAASDANAPQSLPANFNGFDEDKHSSPAAPPEAQPYTMANGRQIDPMSHTGGVPNPQAVMPTATVQAAPPPSWIDRARNYVADSQFGKNLHTFGQGVYGFLGGGTGSEGQPETTTASSYLDPDQYVRQVAAKNSPYKPIAGAKQVVAGLTNIGESYENAQSPEGRKDAPIDQAAKGATQVMSGGMEIAKPLIGESVAAAPIKASIYYGAGILAGKGSAEIAQQMGATPDEVEFFNTVGFFIPSVLTGMAGLKTASIPEGARVLDPVTGEAVPVRGGVVAGKGFAAGAARSDTGGYAGQVRVGPYSAAVKFGRNAPEAPGGPAQPQMESGAPTPGSADPNVPAASQDATAIQQRAQSATVAEAAASAAAINLKAAQIVGMAPPPPPPPAPGQPGSKQAPPPTGIDQGHISQRVMSDLGTAITQLPPDVQPKAVLEATGKLAKVMFDSKTFIGPDGKVVNVDSQKAAQTEAVKLVNDQVEKRQQDALDAKAAQDKVLEQQQKDADAAAQEREKARQEAEKNQPPPPIPDNPVTQAIRTELAKLPVNAKRADVMFAARKAGAAVGRLVPEKLASQFYDEFVAKKAQQEDAATAGITGEQVNHDQNPIALGRMANDVQQGKTAFLHVQPGTKFKPTGLTKETGFISTKVDKAADPTFNGVYFHPAEIKSKDVKAAANGEAPLAHLRGLEASWKVGQSPVTETEAGTTGGKEPQEGEGITSAPGAQPVSSPSSEQPSNEVAKQEVPTKSKDVAPEVVQSLTTQNEPVAAKVKEPAQKPAEVVQPKTFKPGDKVTVKQPDGTSKPDVVRFMSPTGKVILKGQRKPVAVEDVSPAGQEKALQAAGNETEADKRTYEHNINATSHEVVEHNGQKILELNDDGMAMFDKVLDSPASSDAIIISGEGADNIAHGLRVEAAGTGRQNAIQLNALADSFAHRTPAGNVIILRAGISDQARSQAVAEEMFHDWQYQNHLNSAESVSELNKRMENSSAASLWKVAADALRSGQGYHESKIGIEIPAQLFAGRHELLGLTPEQSDSVQDAYLQAANDLINERGKENGESIAGNDQKSNEGGTGGRNSDNSSLQSQRPGKESAAEREEGTTLHSNQLEAAKNPGEIKYLSGGIGAVFSPELLKKAIASAPAPVHDLITGAQNEYANVRKSRSLQSGLYDLDSQANADVIRAKRFMESVPGDANDYEAVYHHIEDPTLPLTKLQQKILDDYIRPLMASTTETIAEMRATGADVDSTYVHRIVMNRGGYIDRLLAGSKSTGKGNVLKTKVPSQKSRTMMAVEDKDGERMVVSIKGNRVTAFVDGKPVDLGGLRNGLSTNLEEISPRLDPIAENIISTKAEIAGLHEAERQRQIDSIEKQIERRQRDAGILSSVKGRVPGKYAAHGVEPSFGKRAAITREIAGLEKQLDALKADTAPVSQHEIAALKRLNKRLAGLEEDRSAILDSVPTEHLADEIWKDKTGKQWKITQATTKEIESQTDLEYYHNALGSAVLNWLAVEKQARAVRFLDRLKSSPDFPTIAVPIAETNGAPEGWKGTQLAQMRSYYFEPHIAEVLDWYNDRLKAGDPGAFEKINEFLVSSIFFNPLLHVPNIANHWFVEKGLSGWLNPMNKVSQFKTGLRAIDAVIHQNDDFLQALDAGGPMKSQQYEIRKFAQTFLEKMQQEIEEDPTAWEKTAKALGYANPLKWLEGLKKVSSYITWYTNDIAFLQAAYEKTAHGMDLRTALHETGKHIPDYRMPTRIFDSKGLATGLSNKNFVMFMNYHYGALKSYGETLRSVLGIDGLGKGMGDEQPSGTDYSYENEKGEPVNEAGRTRHQEQMHGLDILAALGFVTFVVYPLMVDKLLKKVTGDKNAQARRAGASTFPYNLIQVAQGEKTPWDAAQSVVTPGLAGKLALEMAMNRDLRTGKQIYSWPVTDAKTFAEQSGERLAGSFGPAAAVQGAHNFGTAKQLWGMAGVSFPQHGGERIATEIAQAKAGSEALTPDARRRMKAHFAALDALRAGDGKTAIDEMNKAGLNAKQQYALRREADADPLLVRVKNFTVDELKTVYQYSTPDEKMRLGPVLRKKEDEERRKQIGLGIKPTQ